MSLGVTYNLPALVPTRNPVWYEVLCTGYTTEEATTAEFRLSLIQDPTAGQKFSLTVNDVKVEMTWVDGTPDGSGTQIEVGADITESASNLFNALYNNWQLDQWFTITPGAPMVLRPRKPGALPVVFANTSPVTLSWTVHAAGSDATVAPNYKAVVQVWVERVWDSGIYEPLPAMSKDPDANEKASWNLRTQLLPTVRHGHSWPVPGSTLAVKALGIQRRFYVTRYALQGTPPVPQKLLRSSICKAWYAGSRNQDRNTLHEIFSLIQQTDTPTPWLTYRGRRDAHEVSPGMEHSLSFYRSTPRVPGTPMVLHLVVTYSDNTTASATPTVDSTFTWNAGEVLTIPCGFEARQLHTLQPDKVPVAYTAQLKIGTTAYSEVHTFVLVPPDANEHVVQYINSLGVAETLRGEGRWEVGMEAEYSEVVRLLRMVNATLPSVEQGTHENILQRAQQTLKWTTGFISPGEFKACLDILFSPALRGIDPETGKVVPLRLKGANQVMRVMGDASREHLYALNLEFWCDDPEVAWSDRGAMPAYVPSDDPEIPGEDT